MGTFKSRDSINEIPVCPKCQKPTHRTCRSWMEKENGRRYIHSKWTCGECDCKYTADIDLDSDSPGPSGATTERSWICPYCGANDYITIHLKHLIPDDGRMDVFNQCRNCEQAIRIGEIPVDSSKQKLSFVNIIKPIQP